MIVAYNTMEDFRIFTIFIWYEWKAAIFEHHYTLRDDLIL